MTATANFDLRLAGSQSAITAEVLDSPAGQTSTPVTAACDLAVVAWSDLGDASLAELRAAGLTLWRAVFALPGVAELWRASLAAVGPDDTLRLRLTLDSPELAALPWELLYDEALDRFLALDGRTPVTRFVRLPFAAPPWPEGRPLRLLFTGASPADVPRLNVAAEWAGIEQGLAPLVQAGRLTVSGIVPEATVADLNAALRRGQADLWHFAGHGAEGGLLFADAAGQIARVEAFTLGQLLAGEGVRLAVLNACRTGAGGGAVASGAGSLLRAGLAAVVAMQDDIPDAAAQAFASAFYDAIAVGQGVDRAVTAGRKAVLALGGPAWWMPALYMRTPEGQIWQKRAEAPVDDRVSEARARELAYLEGLVTQYTYWAEKYTPLAGIAEVRAAAAQGPRLDLPMLFMPAGFEKLEEHGFGPDRRTERVPVDDLREAVKRYKRLVLLGEPGSGKTTTLWRLAYDYALAAQVDPRAPLPLLVPLGGYSGPEPTLAYSQRQFGALSPELPAYLRSGRVILLLDALNEMPQAGYKERVGRIQALLDQYPDAPVVVTCRALNYVETLRLEKLEVKPLDVDRQRAYLHRYLGEVEGEKLFWQLCGGEEIAALWRTWHSAGGTWEMFWQWCGGEEIAVLWRTWQSAGGLWKQFWTANAIPDSVAISSWTRDAVLWHTMRKEGLPSLLAFGRNPFMLVMAAQVYAARGGVLPPNRGRLFAALVDTLLGREEKRCDPAFWPGGDTLRRAMVRLANAMQKAGERGTAVDVTWARQQMAQRGVNAQNVVRLCASATLLDLSDGTVRFVHQFIQEYFAALALVGRLEKGEDLRHYWPGGWTKPSGWEETFVLLAGMLPDMTPLVERLLPVHPALAARCVGESGGDLPGEGMIHAMQARLVALATGERVPVAQRNAAGDALNYVGDARPGVGLRPDGLPDIVWCEVPAGDFIMGNTQPSKKMVWDEEAPQSKVMLDDFAIGKYPVTNAQFDAFVRDGGYTDRQRRCWTEAGWQWKGATAGPERYGGAYDLLNHPAVGVSWYEAVAFCNWLSEKFGKRVALPTEAQWEKAARWTDGRHYPWGEKIRPDHANYDMTIGTTSAVGIFPKGVSRYGALDMSGNVWEWCATKLRYNYKTAANDDPQGSKERMLRGGSYAHNSWLLRCAFRFHLHPGGRLHFLGFRLMLLSAPS